VSGFEAIVAGSHLRFDGVWQRPHQLLSRLAARVPVLFVEEPFLAGADRNAFEERDGLTVLRPLRRERGAEAVDGATLDGVRDWLAGRKPLVWLYTPMMLALSEAFPDAPLVYDCMDDLASFAFAPPAMRARERELLERAGVVFAGGRSLFEARRERARAVMLFPSGVDIAHFAAAQRIEPHPLFARLPGPVFGYFGVIDERIDVDVLHELAAHDCQLVLVGPVVKIDPAVLPRAPNVHFTGQVDYADLPAYLAGFDVALLPFALNEATRNISPTKTPEYAAGGKPIVGTPVPDVVADWSDVVRIAQTPAEFSAACFAALVPDPERIELGIARARERSWDALVGAMYGELVQRVDAPRERRM
jgi:UDP-galactopyranose mutase